jgi:hypothetical protein
MHSHGVLNTLDTDRNQLLKDNYFKAIYEKNYRFLLCGFAVLLSCFSVACSSITPEKAKSGIILTGQKSVQGKPPASLNLSPEKARNAFGYDFNRDGVADWVVVASQQYNDDWYNYAVAVHLSQPGGTYQDVSPSTFDPGDHGNGMEPWAVSANLTDSGDLLITNHNTSPFSSSDKRNSYRFRFVKGDLRYSPLSRPKSQEIKITLG